MNFFTKLLRTQAQIQKDHQDVDPSTMSMTDRCDEIMRQQQFLLDEITELMTALGGPYEKASWKKWKADHKLLKTIYVEDLDFEEFEDIKGEAADVLIFVLNIVSLAGVDGDELLSAVAAKQNENLKRWESGY